MQKLNMNFQTALKSNAPLFCKYVNRIYIFRMEEWSDVTDIIANKLSASTPTGEEELKEDELSKEAI